MVKFKIDQSQHGRIIITFTDAKGREIEADLRSSEEGLLV